MLPSMCQANLHTFLRFAPHMEGSHADRAPHMERRHYFRVQKQLKFQFLPKKKVLPKHFCLRSLYDINDHFWRIFFLREVTFNTDPCPPNIHKWESERTFICQGNMCLRGSTSLKTSRFANEQTRLLAAGDSRARKVPQWFSGNEQGASSRTPTWLHPNLMLMPLEIGIVPEIALLLAQQINWYNLQTRKCLDFFKVSLDKVQIHTIQTFEI